MHFTFIAAGTEGYSVAEFALELLGQASFADADFTGDGQETAIRAYLGIPLLQ
jgi:hypothetical protein